MTGARLTLLDKAKQGAKKMTNNNNNSRDDDEERRRRGYEYRTATCGCCNGSKLEDDSVGTTEDIEEFETAAV